MNEGDGDEFTNFDPQAYWAKENNEYAHPSAMNRGDAQVCERIIQFCTSEKSLYEIRLFLGANEGSLFRYMGLIRGMKNVSVERMTGYSSQKNWIYVYKITDSRKKK